MDTRCCLLFLAACLVCTVASPEPQFKYLTNYPQSNARRTNQQGPGQDYLIPVESNDNATRVAMYWRHMIGRDPAAAAKGAMHWRVQAVEDPENCAKEVMALRKMTSQDPESMVRNAFFYRRNSARSLEYARLSDEYWRKMAVHDPEVTARSAMYWRADPDAAMYW